MAIHTSTTSSGVNEPSRLTTLSRFRSPEAELRCLMAQRSRCNVRIIQLIDLVDTAAADAALVSLLAGAVGLVQVCGGSDA